MTTTTTSTTSAVVTTAFTEKLSALTSRGDAFEDAATESDSAGSYKSDIESLANEPGLTYSSTPQIAAEAGDSDTATEASCCYPTTLSLDKSKDLQSVITIVNEYEDYIDHVAEKILDILATYFWRSDDDTGAKTFHWQGRKMFKEHVVHWVRKNESVKLTLPAFPFKSSNPNKVTGVLPDFGEYLGLKRLNQICVDIRKIYGRGAKVIIATDGAAFNDLLLISDKDVWNYGEAVKAMAKSNGFSDNIEVWHAAEILGMVKEGELTEDEFYRTMEEAREAIKNEFCASEAQIRHLVDTDPDSRLTFAGFKAFCKVDMENTDMKKRATSQKAYMKEISALCIKMMGRSEGFGKLIRAKMPYHLRLSIHPSSGAVKLSICLIPQPAGFVSRSPWMSSVAVSKDGKQYTAHIKDIRDTHELILKDGQPWFYREKLVPCLSDNILERNGCFEDILEEQSTVVLRGMRKEILVTVVVGEQTIQLRGATWSSTPASLLRHVSDFVRDDIMIATVDDELWDLQRPLEGPCTVSFISYDEPEGRKAFVRTCMHVLAGICESEFRCSPVGGQDLETEFCTDTTVPESGYLKEVASALLEGRFAQATNAKQGFERIEATKSQLKEMFAYNKYKMHEIEKLDDDAITAVYRWGKYVDIADGPLICNTSAIKAFKIVKQSASYFLGDVNNDSLQRLNAVAFPTRQLMVDYLQQAQANEKGSHLRIGKAQELFFFNDVSPGSAFLLPNGTKIFNAVQELLREEYWAQDYREVQTPNIYDAAIWKKSGHWAHYKNDMFQLEVEKREWALKPMNCPGHFVLFGHRDRSYKDLPLRIADFGVLHRNEASGALSGLTRVRKFQQDDSHIFCRDDQILSEIAGIFKFLERVYGLFGYTFQLKLSSRPDKYLGDIETWNNAEDQLRQALASFCGDNWEENPGDGAFYGPKIDITIADAFGRRFQCATIQLDYQAPINFDLQYAGPDGKQHRPVVIHRAIIGSFERFLAISTEHFAGKWPFWLNPRQVVVIPVAPACEEYAQEVSEVLRRNKIHAKADLSASTFRKKICRGQLEQYSFMFVVGEKEAASRMVSVRNRDEETAEGKAVSLSLDDAVERLRGFQRERTLHSKF